MTAQTFQIADILLVAFQVLLGALLSADNALVMAIMVRHLPKAQQQRALLYGLGGAFAFRLVAILLAKSILEIWWAQALGGLYLLHILVKHFASHGEKEVKEVKGGFWKTVVVVEFADVAFAADSVLAGVALIGEKAESKLWVVYLGAIISIVLLRFVAGLFIRLLDRYPFLDHIAYVIVGWVGVKLMMMAANSFGESVKPNPLPFVVPEMPVAVFWGVLAVIAVIGTLLAVRSSGPDSEELSEQAAIEDDVRDLHIDEPSA